MLASSGCCTAINIEFTHTNVFFCNHFLPRLGHFALHADDTPPRFVNRPQYPPMPPYIRLPAIAVYNGKSQDSCTCGCKRLTFVVPLDSNPVNLQGWSTTYKYIGCLLFSITLFDRKYIIFLLGEDPNVSLHFTMNKTCVRMFYQM